MTTVMTAMPDAPDPRRDVRTTLTICLLSACVSLLGLVLYHLIRTWLVPADG